MSEMFNRNAIGVRAHADGVAVKRSNVSSEAVPGITPRADTARGCCWPFETKSRLFRQSGSGLVTGPGFSQFGEALFVDDRHQMPELPRLRSVHDVQGPNKPFADQPGRRPVIHELQIAGR